MATQLQRVGVTADLRVHVPRNDRGTLADGTHDAVSRVPGVDAVHAVEMVGVHPDLNTVSTDVRVELTLAVDAADERRVAAALRDGTGVQRVDVRDVGPPD